MLRGQIEAIQLTEDLAQEKIGELESELKKAKAELTIIKRAKSSLTKLEEQLNGQTDISNQ